MQVKSDKITSYLESVKLGTVMVVNAYQQYLEKLTKENGEFYEYSAYYEIIANNNGGSSESTPKNQSV